MKRTFRAHPLMMARFIRPFLFVLVLPLVKGAIQYLMYREISGVLALEAVTFAIICAISLIKCMFFTVTVDGEHLTVRNGVLFRTVSVISFSSLASVRATRNIVDFVFGTVTCHINTEAGKRGKIDYSCKLLRRDAMALFGGVYGDSGRVAITFSPIKISAMAATTSSAVTGLIIAVPVINNIGKLLGVALSDMLFAEINHASRGINTYFPPVVNTITIIFIIAYGFSFAVSFFKYLRFRLYVSQNRIEVRSGVFVTRRTIFKKSALNDICVEQAPLMRLFGLYSMRASVAGYGNAKGEKATLVPCGRRGELNRHLSGYFPRFAGQKPNIRAAQIWRERRRALWLPTILGFTIAAITASVMIIFPYFDRLTLFVGLVLGGIVAYYADLCRFGHRNSRASMGETIYAASYRGVVWRELYCEKDKIGVIKLIKTPADRRYATCKLELTVRSESADRLKVRNLLQKEALGEIKKCFNIDV